MLKQIIVLLALMQVYRLVSCGTIFPPRFKFGVSTAAYQVEGGWNINGKGVSIWDTFTHTQPSRIKDNSTGDVACDSYHLWKEDLKMLKYMNVSFYRFSLSWTRLLPTGFTNKINPDGVRYYNMIIDDLLTHNIEPLVTLYHWDLPQTLQDLGGWTNPEIAQYFEDYASVAFALFGNRVKTWITINEPSSICEGPYGNNNGAPGIYSPGIGDYLCGKTILLAHAKAFRLYDKAFRKIQKGKIGITIDAIWAEPKTNKSEDVDAAEREMQMGVGWWAHPIFSKEGDYPEIMKQRVSEMSKAENYPESRLPQFTKTEVKYIRGTYDFFGLNHYHTWLIENYEYPVNSATSFVKDKGTKGSQDKKWTPNMVPWGFRKLINWVKNEYNNPLVYITENGYPDGGGLNDTQRVCFLKGFLTALNEALMEDKCNVKGYTVWSIMDNMEWTSGYTVKFGLYEVDFNDPNRTRTPKQSAFYYRNVIKTKRIPPSNVLCDLY